MTVLVANVVQATDTFGQWLAKTNQIAVAMSNSAVTTNSNTATGNAAISGTFSANVLATSNTGALRAGQTSSNLIANASSLVIQTSTTANTIYSSSGILIDGVSQFSKYMVTMGNTVITSANLTVDTVKVNSNVQIGSNTTIGVNYINTYNVNSSIISVSANAFVGDNQANVEIDRYGITISDNPIGSYIVNSYMTATDLWIRNIHANTIQIYGTGSGTNTIFQNSTQFLGYSNYFNNGLETGFATTTLRGNLYSNNLIIDSGIDITPSANWDGHITILGNGYRGGISLGNTGMWVGHTSSLATRDLILATNETPRVYIDGLNGNVGVGNNTPTKALTVSPGQIRLTGATSGYVGLEAAAAAGSTTFTLPSADGSSGQFLATNGSGVLSFQPVTGSVSQDLTARSIGVGVAAPGAGAAGEIRAAGNIIAYYSDERLKEVLGPIESALNKVLSLDGFYYKANDTAKELGYTDDKVQVGLSAQKVQEILPEAVFPAPIDEKYLTVQYDKLVPLLIEAIKELKAEIDSLKNGN